jgi:hypothetical protein
MKDTIFFALTLALFAVACQNPGRTDAAATPGPAAPETPAAAPSGSATAADSAAIADAVHAFFRWYNANQERLANDFVQVLDTKSGHTKLVEPQFQRYVTSFKASNAVSQEFIDNEVKFYRAAEKLWQNEDPEEVNSGLDADKYYCAQDMDPGEFMSAPVRAEIRGDRAKATLLLDPEGMNGAEREFELKKENGKWLLTKVVCDMGVEGM